MSSITDCAESGLTVEKLKMASTQPVAEVFDQCYLEVRAKLLEIAASLDRIERADTEGVAATEPRLELIRKSIELLNKPGTNRAEQIQRVFSDPYDPDWSK